MHKTCPKCGIAKPFSEYSKCSARKDGIRYECKPCAVKARSAWAEANRDRVRELNRNWIAKDPERNRRKVKEWAAAHPERAKAYAKAYRLANSERLREQSKDYRRENAERLRIKKALYYQLNLEIIQGSRKWRYWANPEKYREDATIYKKQNRGRYNYLSRLRKLHVSQATPSWLSEVDKRRIREYYVKAAELTEYLGEAYHVDHIVPLCGKTVCGLNVPWNLQLLTARENCAKGNRLEE